MQVLLAITFLMYLARRNRKVKKQRNEQRDILRRIIEQLKLEGVDESCFDDIIKKKKRKKVIYKTPDEVREECQEKIDAATADYSIARKKYAELITAKRKIEQILSEQVREKESVDALIRKVGMNEQYQDISYFNAKKVMQLNEFINDNKKELQKYEDLLKDAKAQCDEYHVKLNALKAEKTVKVTALESTIYLTQTYDEIMKRNKTMDKNFDLSKIIESINNSESLFNNVKATYDTDPYHQNKKMEREADRALAEEYISDVVGQGSGFFFN